MAYTTIDDPSAHFHIQLYTGNATNSTSITNDANAGDFQPDWLWIKNRADSGGTGPHFIVDSSRGANKDFHMNNNEAEHTTTNAVKSFNSDGFTIDSGGTVNDNTDNYVSWQWKANGGTTSTNTAGTNIDTTVQANTTAGFSIMTYTGTGTDNDSIGHGLGAVPHVIAIKNRDETNGWQVYHHKNTAAPETDYLNFNDADATADDSDRWSDQAPSSTVITLGGNDGVSKASTKYICYAFTEIQGYSKFGSYKGNGNANGPFVYTGFKPAWVLTKGSDVGDDWVIIDNKRDTHNRASKRLFPNDSAAESSTANWMDFLSNGFKLGVNDTKYNGNGSTYIYMAFAEHPFVSSKGVPTTAR